MRSWDDDEGWGVLVSPEAPGEVWAHFTHIDADGYRSLEPGEFVAFDYIEVEGGQDGYAYRTTRIVQRA